MLLKKHTKKGIIARDTQTIIDVFISEFINLELKRGKEEEKNRQYVKIIPAGNIK